jgi:enoyl-CoA hydratase
MTDSTVEVVRNQHVVELRFGNPPRHTLTAPMVMRMHELLDQLRGDGQVRVLVVRSATPGVFITHYEVGELSSMADSRGESKSTPASRPAEEERLHPLHELILKLEDLDAITIAALDGLAMGGGLELALGCDFRLARDGQHVFGLPETTVGILPGAGGTQRLARLLGIARAMDLILHARLMTPREALELGVVHRVFDDASFDAELKAFTDNLARRAPIALQQAKRAIRDGVDRPLRDGLLVEQRAFDRTMASEDARHAMKAYLKGETYEFQGK